MRQKQIELKLLTIAALRNYSPLQLLEPHLGILWLFDNYTENIYWQITLKIL